MPDLAIVNINEIKQLTPNSTVLWDKTYFL